jgi:putative transcriptional regulator
VAKDRPSLTGHLLVATPLLTDPNFAGSVVYLCRHDADGALGVILNRPLATETVEIVPEWAERCAPPAVLFDGGPVRRSHALALGLDLDAGRRRAPGWTAVQGPVGMVDLRSEPGALSASIGRVRIFAGSSGWDAQQLDREIRDDAWFVLRGRASDVFTADPHGLWREVLRRHPRHALYAFSGGDASQN